MRGRIAATDAAAVLDQHVEAYGALTARSVVEAARDVDHPFHDRIWGDSDTVRGV